MSNKPESREEDKYLNWWGMVLIALGVVVLAFQNIWIAVGVIMVVIGNNCRLVSVIRTGMRHLADTTVESMRRLFYSAPPDR